MLKVKVDQVAAYLVQENNCSFSNSYDGNMKLQKLLVFANLINIVKNDATLFPEEMYAFENGIVVEDVRVPYRNDYTGYMKKLNELELPKFEKEQLESIDISIGLFNKLTAKELSDLHHELNTWKYKYNKSKYGNSYIKQLSKINKNELFATDIEKLKKIIDSYERNTEQTLISETVNGITFYYDPKEFDFREDNDHLMSMLEEISNEVQQGEDDTFFISFDEEQGIYYY